jgi:hypothetical protein
MKLSTHHRPRLGVPATLLLLAIGAPAQADNYILVFKDGSGQPVGAVEGTFTTNAPINVPIPPSIPGPPPFVPLADNPIFGFTLTGVPDKFEGGAFPIGQVEHAAGAGKCTDFTKEGVCVAWTDQACATNPPVTDPAYDPNCDKWVGEGEAASRVTLITAGRGVPVSGSATSVPPMTDDYRLQLFDDRTWKIMDNNGVGPEVDSGTYFVRNEALSVPEPPTLVVLLSGALALLLGRRRGRGDRG